MALQDYDDLNSSDSNPGMTQASLFVTQSCCPLADMHRTFPDNILFKSKAEPSLQGALYNVLLAYGQHNQAVGYCQVRRASGDAATALNGLNGATVFHVSVLNNE